QTLRPGWIQDWSADSHVRQFVASDLARADKAVRAPVSAFLPRTSVQTPPLQALQDRVLFFFRRHGRLICSNPPCRWGRTIRVSDGSQPPLTLNSSLNESAGFRSLDRLRHSDQ